jgi:hypothetical protein
MRPFIYIHNVVSKQLHVTSVRTTLKNKICLKRETSPEEPIGYIGCFCFINTPAVWNEPPPGSCGVSLTQVRRSVNTPRVTVVDRPPYRPTSGGNAPDNNENNLGWPFDKLPYFYKPLSPFDKS